MDFQQLLAKMQELDQPQVESMPLDVVAEEPVAECPPDMSSAMVPSMSKADEPPPSMSLNLNAQGMDNIEQLMKLVTKVNPDMDKPNMPTMGMEPTIASIKPSMPPLKMLPDLDKEESAPTDSDDDNDDDIITHLNKKLKPFDDQQSKDKDEAFANSVGDSEPDEGEMDDLIRNGDDLHKQKKSFSGKPYRGDNPMAAGAYESTDLRAQIRAELLRRLEEAKGAK